MKLKICGLNPARDVQLCIDLNVHFLGFVFYNKSPRNTDLIDIDILKKYNSKTLKGNSINKFSSSGDFFKF